MADSRFSPGSRALTARGSLMWCEGSADRERGVAGRQFQDSAARERSSHAGAALRCAFSPVGGSEEFAGLLARLDHEDRRR